MQNILTRKFIHQSNLIEGFDDAEIDKQSAQVWERLRDRKSLDHTVIQELNRDLTAHQSELDDMWRGTYRSRNRTRVYVGGREGAEPQMVERLMDNWLLDLMSLTPKEAHIRFEKIHPFIDGNGRTGRMLMWWHQKQIGEPYTYFSKEKVDDYYAWFQDA